MSRMSYLSSTRATSLYLVAMLVAWLALIAPVAAQEVKQIAVSPLSGLAFEDKPIMLPTQRNFQMAMLTASSELGRSCGKMESYGWRLTQAEQDRVNVIFNGAVDWFRGQAFTLETRTSNSVASDITMFTADRDDKHFLLMWSAGELGLVMVMCETSAPLSPVGQRQHIQVQDTALATTPAYNYKHNNLPEVLSRGDKDSFAGFSPVGTWVGNYTCYQGTTGATLKISRLKGDQFAGVFEFYPTARNPYVPTGSYEVYGQYDADTGRILINPGKWLKQPHDYYNTIMIGSFDPVAKNFSGYFQGITGCTSMEAKRSDVALKVAADKPKAKAKPKAKPKKKKAEPAKAAASAPVVAEPAKAEVASEPAPAAPVVEQPPVAEVPPAVAVPSAPTPAAEIPPPPSPPAPEVVPNPAPVVAPTPPAAEQSAVTPAVEPTVPSVPVVAPVAEPAPPAPVVAPPAPVEMPKRDAAIVAPAADVAAPTPLVPESVSPQSGTPDGIAIDPQAPAPDAAVKPAP